MQTLSKNKLSESRSKVFRSFTNWTGLPSLKSLEGLRSMLKWKFTEPDNSKIPSAEILETTLPIKTPNFSSTEKLSATWLGHATVYVQMDGVSFITDPVWAAKASPFSLFGPRRYRKPACKIEDLPTMNFAVISHNHYDHLDKHAVKQLSERFPDMEWFVPNGLGWGEHITLNINNSKYQVFCLPAQHWSQRWVLDRNKSLWSGWAILSPNRKFYYTGDTGFCDEEFRKIGTNLGPFDLAAIPIGCYEPRWFMKSQHIDPAEAVQIHRLVRANKTLAIHWGTYEMGSNEGYLEPRSRLREEVEKLGIRSTDIFTLDHGETWSENLNEPSSLLTPAGSEASSTSNFEP
ncbi:N-acetylphosphatidylethanolamine-hydrolyzing phospholipase D [Aphelenchoides bicaudatus]|nr:N-acetylphosphatidylethanolamine-hydrolyzing phospholipase D [Aphelenchoides bicaudatus]